MNSYAQQLVKGLLLLTAVYIDIVRNKKIEELSSSIFHTYIFHILILKPKLK